MSYHKGRFHGLPRSPEVLSAVANPTAAEQAELRAAQGLEGQGYVFGDGQWLSPPRTGGRGASVRDVVGEPGDHRHLVAGEDGRMQGADGASVYAVDLAAVAAGDHSGNQRMDPYDFRAQGYGAAHPGWPADFTVGVPGSGPGGHVRDALVEQGYTLSEDGGRGMWHNPDGVALGQVGSDRDLFVLVRDDGAVHFYDRSLGTFVDADALAAAAMHERAQSSEVVAAYEAGLLVAPGEGVSHGPQVAESAPAAVVPGDPEPDVSRSSPGLAGRVFETLVPEAEASDIRWDLDPREVEAPGASSSLPPGVPLARALSGDGSAVMASRAPVAEPEPVPEPRTVTVQSGDYLGKIAAAHDTTVQAILDANPEITDANLIQVGQTITLPAALQVEAQASGVDYLIRSGDTLSEIAEAHGVPMDAILALNPQIEDPDLIYAGATLRMPEAPAMSPEAVAMLGRAAAAGAMLETAGVGADQSSRVKVLSSVGLDVGGSLDADLDREIAASGNVLVLGTPVLTGYPNAIVSEPSFSFDIPPTLHSHDQVVDMSRDL